MVRKTSAFALLLLSAILGTMGTALSRQEHSGYAVGGLMILSAAALLSSWFAARSIIREG